MKLVIISGMPATGKTALGEKLSDLLDRDFISKDAIKEKLYASRSRSTYDYLWYEKRARESFFERIKASVRSGQPAIIESNFTKSEVRRLRASLGSTAKITELYCHAKGFTAFRRYTKRNEGKERHPGHHDRRWYPMVFLFAVLNTLGAKWPYGPTGITTNRLDVDTTDFSKIDYDKLVELIREN